jgi:pimeloyl-ACP methyl ester carboxylesterase
MQSAEEWSSLSRNSTNGRTLYRRLAPIRWLFRTLSPVAPWLVGRLAFRLFRFSQRYRRPPRENGWVAEAERLELELDGRRVTGWSWGSGPTVLLMHGWSGRGSQMGAFAEPLVKEGLRVVALDAPGHGGSAGRFSSLPQFAATVELAGRHFGPLRGVIAHSFGAAGTGWALWRGGELRAERLVFVGAPGDLDGYMVAFREMFGLTDASYAALLGALQSTFGMQWEESRWATTIAADHTPMLVIHDRSDPETPYSGGLAIAEAWSNGRLVTTERLGHFRILREPRVIAEAVDFLTDPAVGVEGEERLDAAAEVIELPSVVPIATEPAPSAV